jgi:hypothetical protein
VAKVIKELEKVQQCLWLTIVPLSAKCFFISLSRTEGPKKHTAANRVYLSQAVAIKVLGV